MVRKAGDGPWSPCEMMNIKMIRAAECRFRAVTGNGEIETQRIWFDITLTTLNILPTPWAEKSEWSKPDQRSPRKWRGGQTSRSKPSPGSGAWRGAVSDPAAMSPWSGGGCRGANGGPRGGATPGSSRADQTGPGSGVPNRRPAESLKSHLRFGKFSLARHAIRIAVAKLD